MRIMKTWGLSTLPLSKNSNTRLLSELPVSNPFSSFEKPFIFEEPVKILDDVTKVFEKLSTKG